MDLSADVSQLDAFAASVPASAAALGDLTDVNTTAGQAVLGQVSPPRRTGRLATTLAVVADALGFTLTAGGPEAPYGPIVHAFNPFITRTLQAQETALADAYQAHAEQSLDHLGA